MRNFWMRSREHIVDSPAHAHRAISWRQYGTCNVGARSAFPLDCAVRSRRSSLLRLTIVGWRRAGQQVFHITEEIYIVRTPCELPLLLLLLRRLLYTQFVVRCCCCFSNSNKRVKKEEALASSYPKQKKNLTKRFFKYFTLVICGLQSFNVILKPCRTSQSITSRWICTFTKRGSSLSRSWNPS